MTVLAFDFGTRRIGVAVGNRMTESGEPLMVIDTELTAERFAVIDTLVASWQPDSFVVGQPYHADGEPHPVAVLAHKFARRLDGRYAKPVWLVDETLSSQAAESALAGRAWQDRKNKLDAEAARVILLSYFSSGGDLLPPRSPSKSTP